MKNGRIGHVITVGLIVGFVIFNYNNKKTLSKISKQPTIKQYINRFEEFFDKPEIESAYADFLIMIDMGFSPSAAFDLIMERVMHW